MAGRGPAPKQERRRRNEPERGDWQPTEGSGWQHGEIPEPPDGLMEASRVAWETWFKAWFAVHWDPEDIPAVRQAIRIYDQYERDPSNAAMATQMRLMMDTCGITKKGQQDRHWKPPVEDAPAGREEPEVSGRYAHLRAVPDPEPERCTAMAASTGERCKRRPSGSGSLCETHR